MKNLKVLKAVILLFVAISIISCKDDDNDLNLSDSLIGEWQRSDSNDDAGYKLIFTSDNRGAEIFYTIESDSTGVSGLLNFDWSTNQNILHFESFGEDVTTSFSINSEGQLLLSDITDLHFDKLD